MQVDGVCNACLEEERDEKRRRIDREAVEAEMKWENSRE